MSLYVNVAVVRLFCDASAVLSITAPLRSVLPFTVISKPPAPALNTRLLLHPGIVAVGMTILRAEAGARAALLHQLAL
nr:hypothetical protein [Trinickia caryophylli]